LNKIYKWAVLENKHDDDVSSFGGKSRPGTASTRARPFSAYSRPTTGRPMSGVLSNNNTKKQTEEM